MEIAIPFSIFIFFFNFVTLLLLSNKQLDRKIILKTSLIPKVYLYVALGFIASICILVIPNTAIQLNVNSMLHSFPSAPFSYLRIISAFFLTGAFPGLIVYFVFMKNYDFNLVEKIGIVLLISYCFTLISGLLLVFLKFFQHLVISWFSGYLPLY